MTSILLTGGGTAGHVMPFIALLPELGKNFDRILYAGAENSLEERLAKKYSIPFYGVTVVKFVRGKILPNFKIPRLLSRGVSEAEELLKRLKPDLVFSKGGYVGLPVTLAAKRTGIPFVIHESDMSLGLANRLVRRHAAAIYTAFPPTAKKYGGECVGIPLREELFRAKYDGKKPRPVLLFTGGSLGAKALNDCVFSKIDELTESYDVIHLTGKGKSREIKNPHYESVEYTDDIAGLFAKSDVVISRAGANTAFELTALNKRIIFVPLTHGSRGDQIQNAEYFSGLGAKVIREEKLSSDLMPAISELLSSPPPDYGTRYNNADFARKLLRVAKSGVRRL